MQTQQAGPSAEQIREQVQKEISNARAAAEKAAAEKAQADAGATARITTPDGRTIVVGPPGVVGIGETRQAPEVFIPRQAENVAIAFFVVIGAIIIGLPIMRAIGRRIERGGTQPATISPDLRNQLQQISASVDAIAIEVERISEAQRFQSKLLAEKAPEGTIVTPRAER